MKMGKKVREYKSGDFIFAKVKGYPAWPARVQRMNGKKYFVYFYGTGEIANLPPNMIFDYAENKDKFLSKTVKRRDFNDGVKQIEYDFANNVPLEQVIGVAPETEEGANDTINETANETMDESAADTTTADETMVDENTTQNDTGIEDSDETGALVIDEGKSGKGRKSTAKTPVKETPKAKEPKTPRGKAKKDEEEAKEDSKKEEEIVSRSGRKIRPKRYIDEHTEENTTLPSPAPKKRRGASPVEKKDDKENKDKEKEKEKDYKDKNIKHFNAVTQAELEDLKEPFTPDDPEKENIIICYIPSGQYIGIKLFESRPSNFKNDASRLQWDKQAASNALTLKSQLEKGHITPQSVSAQLVMDLNLTDEEKATLDKDRETEDKKSRVQFLKVEMKLIELDAKIKTCLCLEKADTELCLKLIDELMELDIKPLMLLKHPTALETIKRMRAYVGNTPSWELSEAAALLFSQHAHKIRKQADTLYNKLKELFETPEGQSFWEFFTERCTQFKNATAEMTPEEILEMVHSPIEMSTPTSHTMKSAVEAANEMEKEEEEEEAKKTKPTSAKTKKAVNNTPIKTPAKRQSSRNKPEEKEKEPTNTEESTEVNSADNQEHSKEKDLKESNGSEENEKEVAKDKKENKNSKNTKANKEDDKNKEKDKDKEIDKDPIDKTDNVASKEKESDVKEKTPEKVDENTDDGKTESSTEEDKKESSKEKDKKESSKEKDKKESSKEKEKKEGSKEKEMKEGSKEKEVKEGSKEKETEKDETEKSDKEEKKDKEDKIEDEPRAKRSRESKKTDPPLRSPNKRKSKF